MSELLNEEVIEEELTEEELAEEKQKQEREKMQEWVSILNAVKMLEIPLESFEQPMVSLLKGITHAETETWNGEKAIEGHLEAIERVQQTIMSHESNQGYYYQALESSYTEEQVNEFFERVKKEIEERDPTWRESM